MSQLPCKRFWEGPVGITLRPQKQHSGQYFWTFSFTRSFKRRGQETWEYTDFFGQKHATALGTVMSRALQFMEQTLPTSSPPSAWLKIRPQQDEHRIRRRREFGGGLIPAREGGGLNRMLLSQSEIE